MRGFRRLLFNTSIYGLAPFVPKIASVFTLPFITPFLTSTDYGIIGVLDGYLALVTVLGSLGLRVVLVNSFYRSRVRYKVVWRQLYAFLTIWGLIYGLFVGILIWMILPIEAKENTWSIIFAKVVAATIFNPIILISPLYYQLNQKPKPIFFVIVISGFLSIGCNILFISHFGWGYMGWIYSILLTSFTSATLYILLVLVPQRITPIFNFKWTRIRTSLRVSLPAIPHFYSGILLKNSDKVVLNELNISSKSIGLYSLAANFENNFASLATAIGTGLGPQIREYYKLGRDDLARKLIFISTAGFLLFCFICCLWLKEIFIFLIKNDELNQVYPLAIILIMGQVYRPMYYGFSIRISYEERTNELWKVTLVGAVVNLFLNLTLIPTYGFQIAAITTFTSYIIMGLIGYYKKSFRSYDSQNYFQEVWSLVFIFATVIVYYAVHLDIYYKTLITILVFSIVIVGFNRFKNEIAKFD